LLDFVERQDVEADGNFYKYFQVKPEKNEWEVAKDDD
jgi:hypothetical protein